MNISQPKLRSEKFDDNDDNNNNNNVDDTDLTMIALTVAGMAEAFSAGIQFPLGTLVPTKPLVECLPTGIQLRQLTWL